MIDPTTDDSPANPIKWPAPFVISLGHGIGMAAAAASMFQHGPLLINDFRRQPKPRKVSAAKLAKRAKQKAQRNARKVARKANQ